MSPEKVDALVGRYPRTHFSIAKWNRSLDPVRETVETAVHDVDRTAPIDLLRFPADSVERFVDEKGRVSTSWSDVSQVQVGDAEVGREQLSQPGIHARKTADLLLSLSHDS